MVNSTYALQPRETSIKLRAAGMAMNRISDRLAYSAQNHKQAIVSRVESDKYFH